MTSMRTVSRTSKFKKDVKRLMRQGKTPLKLKTVIQLLANAEPLSSRYQDHPLKGPLKDCRECHIEPDWLLIYRISGNELNLIRTGSHSELFSL